jgi:phage repressor protein C with HTH and peptisase S24 domain
VDQGRYRAATSGGTPAAVGQGPAEVAQALPDYRSAPSDAFVLVPKAQARLSATGGLMPEEGLVAESYAFNRDWLSKVITSSRNAVLLQVDGDSMEPLLSNGDTVLIDMGRATLVNGGIHAIGVGDVAQIKRLEQLPKGRIHVTAANPDYHDWVAEPDEIRVLGRVVWRAQTLI